MSATRRGANAQGDLFPARIGEPQPVPVINSAVVYRGSPAYRQIGCAAYFRVSYLISGFMPMFMVKTGRVEMRMCERLVKVPMRMRFCKVHSLIMGVLMVFVVDMAVGML